MKIKTIVSSRYFSCLKVIAFGKLSFNLLDWKKIML